MAAEELIAKLLEQTSRDELADIIKEVSDAQNVADVLKVAKAHNIELNEEQAELLLKTYSEEIELDDSVLQLIAGGANSRGC